MQIQININIKSDYRFYSFSKEFNSKNIKTGLGSSSALISSLTTNMILIYDYLCKKCENYNSNNEKKENKVIRDFHDKNLQAIILGSCLLSNNLSQNKIGSCFDIISSLFGSQIFTQTKKNVFLNSPFYLNDENIKMINNIIVYLKDEYIPNIIFLKKDNIFLNNNISFISIEIGTDTRIFVKKVLDYANSKKTKQLYDDELFTNLNMINEQIINIFTQNLNNINNNNLLIDLCKKYRQTLRLISEESKVDIEPKILTSLLDKLIDNKNIIYSICPGAGGYDSIISIGNFNVEKKVLINEIQQIINEFNINNKNKGINIKANILDVNIAKDFGTIVIIN
jgi:phosphomevalonate kinase